MNSSIINISEILNNAEVLVSAGFSDGYNFDDINASEYFDELIENSAFPSPIFSGILIMTKSGDNFTIVDGFQRITTISLLLCALCESYKNTSKKNEEAKNKIFNRYLINQNKPKLKLKGLEQVIYKKILLGEGLSEKEKEHNLFQTYKSFLNRMNAKKISGTELFRVISKIEFMLVLVEDSEISTRELYRALNKNKDNSQINLILDFIRQKDAQAGITWQKIANSYRDLGLQHLLDSFIRDFLTIQFNGKIPNKNALYNKFKSYFAKISKYQDTKTIIKNMCKYAQYYLKIVNAYFENEEIKNQIIILNQNNGKDAYPYLMEVLDDLENGHLNTELFLEILTMINLFITKRQEDPINSTIDFANLSKELNKMLALKDYSPNLTGENKITINEMNNLPTFEV
jgi:hypothetical protein